LFPDTSLIVRVRRFVAQHHLAGRGTRVVVALSGGSDSVALAHIVRDLEAAGELQVAGIVHLNHQLRETAGRDEQFSVGLAESFGWRAVVEREDVAARARREHRSIENAARTARYACFERARATLVADVVALGHTRDDQAETFLLRLLRGAGPKGLAGIHPRHGPIVRPVLSCRRHELRQFLAARQIAYVEDETNADVAIPRNRVRAELLPLLERRFNPAVVDILADQAEFAREMWLCLEDSWKSDVWNLAPLDNGQRSGGRGVTSLDDAMKSGAESTPEADSGLETSGLDLDVARLKAAPIALRRFVIWRAMGVAAGRRPVSYAHVQAALELLESEAPRSIDGPGHSVQRSGPRLVLRRRHPGARPRPARPNFFDYPLSIPGEVTVPEASCVVAAAPYPAGTIEVGTLRATSSVAVVRRDRYAGHWRVRNRRPGDRFWPIGVGGQKKLQDFFVDRKLPRPRRDTVPLVVDERDRIVWVAGFGIDEAFRVTDPAQAVIMLELKLLGGSA
jgi:tRNA(Ile)-lysidine synthase